MLRIVDSRWGRVLVNDKDKYVGRSFIEYGEFSPGETELFSAIIHPSMTVADIGANYGAHTLFFARHASHVYAVEAQRPCYHALCGSLALNNIDNVDAVNAAVGRTSGSIKCAKIEMEREENFGAISLLNIPSFAPTYDIPLIPFHSPCHFMKIDVEGMEEDVLVGAAEMIEQYKPILFVENDRKDNSASLISCVHDLGYVAYWHISLMYSEDNYFKNPVNIFKDICSLNMLCVPKDVKIGGLPRVESPVCPGFTYTQ